MESSEKPKNIEVAEQIKLVCEEFGVQRIDDVENMKGDQYAYLSIDGVPSDKKVFIFDVSRPLALHEPEGNTYHAFLKKVCSYYGGSVGGVSVDNAKRMVHGLTFTGICFEKKD